MKQNVLGTALVAAVVLLAANARGQISLTSGNMSYSQDFDTLTRSTIAETWTDNAATTSVNDPPQVVGLVGWYAGNFGTTAVTPLIRAGTGSSSSGSFYSYGSAGASDRALGTLPQDSVASGSMRLGVRFVNNSGDAITGFSFSYDGEQWRNAGVTNINNQYVVAYQVFAAGGGSLGATYSPSIASATFDTPFDGSGTSTSVALDGNLAANRVAGLTGSVTGLSVANGDEIWLRWFDANSSSLDQGIAIDNFLITFTPIPEPSSLILVSLGFFCLVRRAQRRS
jgi:hypothetical protein